MKIMTPANLPATERVTLLKVEPSEGYWQFLIPSEKRDIRLSTTLSPADTQEAHAKYVSPSGFRIASYKGHFQVFSALYELRNKGAEVELARQFVRDTMRTQFPSTSTRLQYNPEGQKDAIIHNYGTDSPEEILVDFVGSDMPIDKMPLEVCLALTGKTPQEAGEIMSYINDRTPVYLWRVNSKPAQRDERVARFVAFSDRAYLDCNWGTDDRYPAFRVSRKKN